MNNGEDELREWKRKLRRTGSDTTNSLMRILGLIDLYGPKGSEVPLHITNTEGREEELELRFLAYRHTMRMMIKLDERFDPRFNQQYEEWDHLDEQQTIEGGTGDERSGTA
jgi:hypothetical protein